MAESDSGGVGVVYCAGLVRLGGGKCEGSVLTCVMRLGLVLCWIVSWQFVKFGILVMMWQR